MNDNGHFNEREREYEASETEGRPVGGEEYRQEPAHEESEPQWYGVSYDREKGNTYTHPVQEKEQEGFFSRMRRKRLAVLALGLAFFALVSFFAGSFGYALAKNMIELEEQNDTGIMPSGANGLPGTADVYENTDNGQYDFSSVTIGKNDGSTLVGSDNGSAGDAAMSRIEAIAAVHHSVVEIATTTVSSRGQINAGAGSGVIIHADGVIVTNNHVIDGVDTIYVRLTNGNTYEAVLRGTDEENDIAILKITPQETLTVARLGCSAALALGEEVIAIGNPLGELGGTVTNGIISALEREVLIDNITMTLLQTNAAINSGNSGGGLFNLAGELVGVVNAKYSASGVEGLGFAIPIDTAILSINALLEHGYMPGRADLGVTVAEKNVFFNGRLTSMPYMYAASEDSPLKVGDLIYKIGEKEVFTASELKRAVRAYAVGDTVAVTVYRDNGWLTVNVTLCEYVPENSSVDFQ